MPSEAITLTAVTMSSTTLSFSRSKCRLLLRMFSMMQLYRMALAKDGSSGNETSSRPRSVNLPVEVKASMRNKFLRLLSS